MKGDTPTIQPNPNRLCIYGIRASKNSSLSSDHFRSSHPSIPNICRTGLFLPSKIQQLLSGKNERNPQSHRVWSHGRFPKHSENFLYWDTHRNWKGAFLAYTDFARLSCLPVPETGFKQDTKYKGDLIEISKLENFPLHAEDNREIVWKNEPVLTEEKISDNENDGSFGPVVSVTNENPLSDKHIWIIGDSLTTALRPYFNAVFSETKYIGHWSEKPDMIVIVRVKYSF